MEKTILIVDDEKAQVDGLCKSLSEALPDITFIGSSEETEMKRMIEHRFYSIAIVDLRMDKFAFDGIDLIKEIFQVNPFANIIIVSAFKDEYFGNLKELILTGKIINVFEKEQFKTLSEKLVSTIREYYEKVTTLC